MYAKILGSHMAMINGAKIEQFLLIHTRFRQLPLSLRVNYYLPRYLYVLHGSPLMRHDLCYVCVVFITTFHKLERRNERYSFLQTFLSTGRHETCTIPCPVNFPKIQTSNAIS